MPSEIKKQMRAKINDDPEDTVDFSNKCVSCYRPWLPYVTIALFWLPANQNNIHYCLLLQDKIHTDS